MMGVGVVGLISKVHKWDESAMFFDGSSLGTVLVNCPAIAIAHTFLIV